MARIPEHIIDRVRESVDIVDVVSRYVSLKKQGKNFIGLCPFHTEKTPSFTVSPDKQIFYCFGCHAGGNVFNFLMKHEKMSFVEAIEKLAGDAGIEIPKYKPDEREVSEYDRLYRANQFAADYFHQFLKNHPGQIRNYLSKRGILDKSLNDFKIGYVADAWDGLYKEISRQKMSLEPFLRAGLILRSEKDPSRLYDRFRNRLMFPIYNLSGRVIAFGGRTLSADPNTPKYVNSPESRIYNKREVLFGLHSSKEWIRQEGFAIFVEGYMDFLQLWQSGVKNVVATSGTSLTENHAKLIRRYTGEVTLCYDADAAGIKAAERGGQILFQNNLEVKVLLLPSGEDPDSFVRSHGASEFHSLLETARSFYDFKLKYLLDTIGGDTVSGQTRIVSELLDSLAAHPDVIKVNFYINKIAQTFGLQEQALMAELQKKRGIYRTRRQRLEDRQTKQPTEAATGMFLTGAWSAEKDVIVLLLNHFEKMKDVIFEVLQEEEFSNQNLRRVFCFIRDHQHHSGAELTHLVLAETNDEQVVSMLTADLLKEITNPAQYLNDCIYRIKIAYVQSQIDRMREQLKDAKPDSEEYTTLIRKINERFAQKQKLQKVFTQD